MISSRALETRRLYRQLAAMEKENTHLKQMLSDMADALYAIGHHKDLQPALEILTVAWMGHANQAAIRALTAERAASRS